MMPNVVQQSGELSSLMTFLNEVELISDSSTALCHPAITTSTLLSSNVGNKNESQEAVVPIKDNVHYTSSTKESKEEGDKRKYVWDEIQIIDVLDNDEITNPSLFNDAKNKSEAEKERASSIRDKIKHMKREYDAKSEQLLQLKTTLARKKAAIERKLKVIKDNWDKRFVQQNSEHDKVGIIISGNFTAT